MSKLTFAEDAWEEYLYWQTQDRIVYEIREESILVLQCKGHYGDK